MPVVALAAAAGRSEHGAEAEAGRGGEGGQEGGGLEAEWVASGSGDMTIKVWRLSQAPRYPLPSHPPPYPYAYP